MMINLLPKSDPVDILRHCRVQLEEVARHEIVTLPTKDHDELRHHLNETMCKECDVEDSLLSELRAAESREVELSARCLIAKDENKLEYANSLREIVVLRNKIRELTGQINRMVNQSDFMVGNRKRAKIILDRLDDMLRTLIENPTCPQQSRFFVPLPIARERALQQKKSTSMALSDVKDRLRREKHSHTEWVADTKAAMKKARSELNAMDNGTYAPALAFEARMLEMETTQAKELDGKRTTVKEETERLQELIARDVIVHNSNASTLESEIDLLRIKMKDTVLEHEQSMKVLDSTLDRIRDERLANQNILESLDTRIMEEREEEKLHQDKEEKRLLELKDTKAKEEKKYFAALWIQLRWKSYRKRKAMKDAAKGKKGKKGSKKL